MSEPVPVAAGRSEVRSGARPDPLPLRLLDGLTQAMNVAGSALILVVMALIVVDVLGRNLAGRPLSGVPELVALAIVAIVFLQVPQALRAGRLPRSEALLPRLARRRPRLARWLEDLYDAAGALVAAVIVHATWPLLEKAWTRGDFVGAVGDFTAPTWPVRLAILVGAATLGLQFLARIARRRSVAPGAAGTPP